MNFGLPSYRCTECGAQLVITSRSCPVCHCTDPDGSARLRARWDAWLLRLLIACLSMFGYLWYEHLIAPLSWLSAS